MLGELQADLLPVCWNLPGADPSPTWPQEVWSRKHPDLVIRMGWTLSDLPPATGALLWGVILEKGGLV